MHVQRKSGNTGLVCQHQAITASSKDNKSCLFSERINAGDNVFKNKKTWKVDSQVWEKFKLFIIAMTKKSLE